jgi:hypothetical protein
MWLRRSRVVALFDYALIADPNKVVTITDQIGATTVSAVASESLSGPKPGPCPRHGMAKLNPVRTSLTFCPAMSASRSATSRASFSLTLQMAPTRPEYV